MIDVLGNMVSNNLTKIYCVCGVMGVFISLFWIIGFANNICRTSVSGSSKDMFSTNSYFY